MLVSYTKNSRCEHSNPLHKIVIFLSLNWLNSVTTFGENSISIVKVSLSYQCNILTLTENWENVATKVCTA